MKYFILLAVAVAAVVAQSSTPHPSTPDGDDERGLKGGRIPRPVVDPLRPSSGNATGNATGGATPENTVFCFCKIGDKDNLQGAFNSFDCSCTDTLKELSEIPKDERGLFSGISKAVKGVSSFLSNNPAIKEVAGNALSAGANWLVNKIG